MAESKDNPKQEIALNVNLDNTPVYYTDNIQMTVNEDGIVFDVMQRFMNTNQVRIVTRFGMSGIAKKFLHNMGNLLALTEGQSQTGKKN